MIRRVIEKSVPEEDLAIPSFSARTIVYKGMLTSPQLPEYFPELHDERIVSALALVHSRFSTNTFPSWELAHPYRMIAHNGEINTLRGNVNWMRARESQLFSEAFGDDLEHLLPVVRPGGSDSATFDNVLELLVLAGRSLPHSLMMMIPEAWEGRDDLDPAVSDFYAFHSCLLEPWDGPAAVCFTDGRGIGATLDRNGLRPGRWAETKDGFVVLASETGVLDFEPEEFVRKGRLQPGKIFYVDVENGKIVEDAELKAEIAGQQPYGDWYRQNVVHLDDMEDVAPRDMPAEDVHTRQLLFGYSQEDLRITLARMGGTAAEEPTGSMGNDAALAVLSRPRPGALLVLQAAVRAGHEPADRPDPREGRDEPVDLGRPRAQPARGVRRARAPARDLAAAAHERRAREAAPGRPRRLPVGHARRDLAGRRGRGRAEGGDGPPLQRGLARP